MSEAFQCFVGEDVGAGFREVETVGRRVTSSPSKPPGTARPEASPPERPQHWPGRTREDAGRGPLLLGLCVCTGRRNADPGARPHAASSVGRISVLLKWKVVFSGRGEMATWASGWRAIGKEKQIAERTGFAGEPAGRGGKLQHASHCQH